MRAPRHSRHWPNAGNLFVGHRPGRFPRAASPRSRRPRGMLDRPRMGLGAGTFETSADGALSDGDLHARVDAQRAAALYGRGVSPYLSNVMIGAIEVVAVASVVPAARRYGWLVLMSVVTLVRLGVWRFNHR